ncbi:MAG: MotA/TolQ/ExbB proton channel family protein [Chitinivibrionales bacterium]|nr:MotA/TolQ/ExbB proton channel family protein [Chitinivibrionales bacterium]
MKNLLVVFMICIVWLPLMAANKKKELEELELAKQQQELDILKSRLADVRDSLQNEIAARWQTKQRFVEQKEADKQESDRLRETLERTYSELSQVKEEIYTRTQALEEEKKTLQQKKEDWSYVNATKNDLLQKQADGLIGGFPLDLEERRADLENIRRKYKNDESSAAAFAQFMLYKKKYIKRGMVVSFDKKTVLTDNDGLQLLNLIRFGDVFGYGVTQTNVFYSINQSGRLGSGRYTIDKIESARYVEYLQKSLPPWIQSQKVSGTVMFDIMQNNQSKVLIAGKEVTTYTKVFNEFKAGGPVMIPLLLLPIWALILTLAKMFQFGRRRSVHKKIFSTVSACLDKNDYTAAIAFCKKQKAGFSRIVEACLLNVTNSRTSAERAVQEVMVDEIPKLNTFLNTLSVIAGAAPLLGLLGTISGMINLFAAVTYHGTGDPKFLAGGISEALITAKTGLAIAIPVLFIHDLLRNKRDHIQADIEKFSIRILNRLWPKD